MNKYVSRGLWFTLCVGGLWLAGTAAANAAEAPSTTGSGGVASGTQAVVDATVPVNLTGNGIALLGDASSTGAASSAAAPAPAPALSASTSGLDGVASGEQALVSVSVPVAVTGNAVSAAGDAGPSASPGSGLGSGAGTAPAAAPAADLTTSGTDGVLSGAQAPIAVSVPVTATGNAISVLGDAGSSGASGSSMTTPAPADSGATTSGSDGILSGEQVPVGVAAPVTASGNAVSVLGDAGSSGSSVTASPAPATNTSGATTSGSDGVLSGIQVPVGASAPVTASGNAVSVLGDAGTSGSSATVPSAPAASGGSTSGAEGVGSGAQVPVSVSAPVVASGDAVSVLGDATSTGSTGSTGSGSTPVVSTTDGTGGFLGGTQLPMSVSLPITVGGDAVAVLGDSTTSGSTTGTTDPTTPTGTTGPDAGAGGGSSADGTASGQVAAASSTGATTLLAASDATSALASTGSDALTLGALGALLALLGTLAVFATANRERRHHTR